MVRRWFTLRGRGWQRSAIINGVGAVTTGLVLLIISFEKFAEGDWLVRFSPAFLNGATIGLRAGAWMVIALIPAMVWLFHKVHDHYVRLSRKLSLQGYRQPPARHNKVVVLTSNVHRGIIPALQFAQSISTDVQALYVELDPERTPRIREKWEQWGQNVPLVVLESPYRSLVEPVLKYIDYMDALRPDDHIVVVLPEFVTPNWWEKLLHNHAGLMLKFALLFKPNVIVANVRYWVSRPQPRPATLPAELSAGHVPVPRPTPARVGRSRKE
jgi:hypothetical protein